MKLGHRTNTLIEPGEIRRPESGPTWKSRSLGLPLQGLPAWQSNGGVTRGHPGRSKPYLLHVDPPKGSGNLTRVHIVGVFAICGEADRAGTVGATLAINEEDENILTLDLVAGRHYSDARDLRQVHRLSGDGASIETVGTCKIEDTIYRVDQLTIDMPAETPLAAIELRDAGSPAIFAIFDVLYEFVPEGTCPFKIRSGGVALGELAAVVRVGDRVKLRRALDQLEDAIRKTQDLDEAKGEALTFIAVVTAATLEIGASRTMHRVQLRAARTLDQLTDAEDIISETRCIVEDIAIPLANVASPSAHLVDKALAILNRNFAKDISDSSVADQLGLSTSHFRYLFKEVTGQPFHKYLISLRLERAKKMLLEQNLPVSEVASAVGFNGLAHFSRAFTQRFSVTPTNLRRTAPSTTE